MIEKYGKYRVRFVSINVGIVIENFYLVTTTLGLDIVALEGLSNEIEKNIKLGMLIGITEVC